MAAAFVAGSLVRSPWDAATRNAATSPVVTAAVTTRSFPAQIPELTGTVSSGTTVDVAVPAAASARAVVTKVDAKAGTHLKPGDALVEVSGRPVIALALPFTLYRDLTPGMSGPDVQALQHALATIGVYHGTPDGTYGAGTSAAVRALYQRAGLTPPASSADAQAALADAKRAQSDDTSDDTTAGDSTGDDTRSDTTSSDLAATTRAADTPLPYAEIVDVPSDGAQVVSVKKVGTLLDGAVATLRTGTPTAKARVDVGQAKAFTQGAAVTVADVGDTDHPVTATVTTVSGFKKSEADDSDSVPGYDVTIKLPAAKGGSALDDGDKVVIRSAGSKAKAAKGLTVPVVALRQDHDGTYVLVEPAGASDAGSADGTPRHVTVTVGSELDGYAMVTGDGLADGQAVAIGGVS
jgi:peptidoglycan hydrolase-like protein with peptidoglycan-binding domain